MKIKYFLVSLLILSSSEIALYAAENIWTKDTKTLSQQDRDAIIKAYRDNNQSDFEFEDDIEPLKISDIEDNILVVGLSLGYGSVTETVSNTRGSYDVDYTMSTLKLLIGKDFSLWHDEYTEPVRIYLTYRFNTLSTDVDYTTITLGIKENMRFWPLYESKNYIIYPTLSYEIGGSNLTRKDYDISGVTTEFAGGLAYERGNFEYALNLAYNQTAWEHPINGIKDEAQGLHVHMNINYRWMHNE